MLIDLSGILSGRRKVLDVTVPCTLKAFRMERVSYPVRSASDLHLHIAAQKEKRLLVEGTCEVTVEAPCDRCLQPVPVCLALDFLHDIDSRTDVPPDPGEEEPDENNYIDGYQLDTDSLLSNEILVAWPMKVLCSDSCKGICSRCGQDLNKGTCNCEDMGSDPRMSVIRDVFQNFKEV